MVTLHLLLLILRLPILVEQTVAEVIRTIRTKAVWDLTIIIVEATRRICIQAVTVHIKMCFLRVFQLKQKKLHLELERRYPSLQL